MYTLPLSVAQADKAERGLAAFSGIRPGALGAPGWQHRRAVQRTVRSAIRHLDAKCHRAAAARQRPRWRACGGAHTPAFREIWGSDRPQLAPSPLRGDYNHSALTFGDRFFLKLFRKVEPGPQSRTGSGAIPGRRPVSPLPPHSRLVGIPRPAARSPTLGYSEGRVQLGSHRLAVHHGQPGPVLRARSGGVLRCRQYPRSEAFPVPMRTEIPAAAVRSAWRLRGDDAAAGQSAPPKCTWRWPAVPTIRPSRLSRSPISTGIALYHGDAGPFHAHLGAVARQTGERCRKTRAGRQPSCWSARRSYARRLQMLRDRRINVTRIRHHGDYHLGQVLHTGKDFVIDRFRRRSAPAHRPAAHQGLPAARCGQHAALARLRRAFGPVRPRPGGHRAQGSCRTLYAPGPTFWSRWAGALYLAGYLETAGRTSFLPAGVDDARVLLQFYLLERALLELTHELTQRLDWVRIPLHGLLEILDTK